MKKLQRNDLQVGDVLIFYGFNPISFLQAIQRMFFRMPGTILTLGLNTLARANTIRGHWSAHHAAIISQTSQHTVELTHAVKDGVGTIDYSLFYKSFRGHTKVFRLVKNRQDAQLAGKIASTWGPDDLSVSSSRPSLSYATRKVLAALWRPSIYRQQTKARAQHYFKCAKTAGGPTRQNNPNQKTKMFCSMLIGACYHAALWDEKNGDKKIRECMKLDPQSAYPPTLDGYLKQSTQWKCVGSF